MVSNAVSNKLSRRLHLDQESRYVTSGQNCYLATVFQTTKIGFMLACPREMAREFLLKQESNQKVCAGESGGTECPTETATGASKNTETTSGTPGLVLGYSRKALPLRVEQTTPYDRFRRLRTGRLPQHGLSPDRRPRITHCPGPAMSEGQSNRPRPLHRRSRAIGSPSRSGGHQ